MRNVIAMGVILMASVVGAAETATVPVAPAFPPVITAAIKAAAAEEHPDDFALQAYTVKNDLKAYRELGQ
jgi:hypothetical protein